MDENNVVQEGSEATKKKKPIMLYVAIFAAQIIASLALLYFVVLPMMNGEPAEGETASAEVKPTEKKLEHIFRLDGLTVNPKNSGGKRFAVFEVVMSVDTPETVETLKKQRPIIKDRYIRYFRSKTIAELSVETVMEKGRDELKQLTNELLGTESVNEIYFTRFVLQ